MRRRRIIAGSGKLLNYIYPAALFELIALSES